jgi:hypothetical protein
VSFLVTAGEDGIGAGARSTYGRGERQGGIVQYKINGKRLGSLPIRTWKIDDILSLTNKQLSFIVLRTLGNRKSTRGIPLSINDIDKRISVLLTKKPSPYDLRKMAVRMIQRKNAEAQVNTDSGHI